MFRAREKRNASARSSAHRLPPGARIACAVSTYHEDVTGEMLSSALEALAELGVERESVLVVPCPGAFELPLVARRLAKRKDVVAVLCFGLVLKGETEHDRYISEACAHGLTQVALETDTPVLFGVLTCANLEQARTRARPESEGGQDKGREVALAALESLAALQAAGTGAKKASGKRAR
jgi:6,7-dimethyl-8-ribityllumazine synthase